MAHYTIRKRFRAEQPVFCASAIQKNKGKITFSKSKTHSSISAAVKWAKNLVSHLERNEAMNHLGLKEMTLVDLIVDYMESKSSSNRPIGLTARVYKKINMIKSYTLLNT